MSYGVIPQLRAPLQIEAGRDALGRSFQIQHIMRTPRNARFAPASRTTGSTYRRHTYDPHQPKDKYLATKSLNSRQRMVNSRKRLGGNYDAHQVVSHHSPRRSGHQFDHLGKQIQPFRGCDNEDKQGNNLCGDNPQDGQGRWKLRRSTT
jgi:hypothetical protein